MEGLATVQSESALPATLHRPGISLPCSHRASLPSKRGLIGFRAYDLKRRIDQFSMLPVSADPMNLVTLDDLSTRSNSISSASWRTAQGVVWGGLSVAILSGWFVVNASGTASGSSRLGCHCAAFWRGGGSADAGAACRVLASAVSGVVSRDRPGCTLGSPVHTLGRTWLAGDVGHIGVLSNAGIDAGIRRSHRVDTFG